MTEAEFLPLFDQYRPMVYGLALSYTRSPQDAEDVCQEVFLTLLEKPPAPGKERPWLARVAVNRCRDLLTSPWRRRRENDDTALERHPPGCRGGALQRSAGGIYPLLLGSAD